MLPDIRAGPSRLAVGVLDVDRAILSPHLLARILVECRNELLLLVVVDDDDEVIHQSRRRSRAEIEDGRVALERRTPDLVPLEIVGEEAQVVDVHVDSLTICDGSLRAEAVLPVAASRGLAGVKFALPVDLARSEIDGVEKVVDVDLVRELEIALV